MKPDEFGGVLVTPELTDSFGGVAVETKPIQPAIEEDPEGASGIYTALLSGLTNDEDNKVFWLAKRRFPEIEDPSIYYAYDENGDLFYRDPYTGKSQKEFRDGAFNNDVDYFDNIGPAGQFLAEVVGGTIGSIKGFAEGATQRNPALAISRAVYRGGEGTAKGGAKAYGARVALSAMLGGPPLDAYTATKDLAISTVTGAIPFGVPSTAGTKGLYKVFLDKFPGVDGRKQFSDIVQNGGKTVDEKLAYMANKYPDIKMSRAEVDGMVGSSGYKAEEWIFKNARNSKLSAHLQDRNERVGVHAEKFFDFIKQGKYITGGTKNKLTGQAGGDVERDVARATEDYIQAEKKILQTRTAPMYRKAYDEEVAIDVTDILTKVDDVLADLNVSSEKKAIYGRIKKSLTDANVGKNTPRSSTELLHLSLKDDFNRIFATLTKDQDRVLKQEVTEIRNTISTRMKEANPAYKQVTEIYDDALGNSLMLDRSIVGQFAKVAELSDDKVMMVVKKLFSGKISPKEINYLKTSLQSTDEGAKAWQNLKGTWLRTKWDDVLAKNTNPLGEPNAFLRAMGLQNPAKALPIPNVVPDATGKILPASADDVARLSREVADYKAVGQTADMWKAIFEPEELVAFTDMTNMMQMVGRLQTKSGSDTFGNFAIDKIFTQEARQIMGSEAVGKQVGNKSLGILTAIANIPSRAARGFDDMIAAPLNAQKEAYMDLLISHIVDPKKARVANEVLQAAKPITYLVSQTFARAGEEGVADLFNSIGESSEGYQTDNLKKASDQRLLDKEGLTDDLKKSFFLQGPSAQGLPEKERENLQGSIDNFQMPQVQGSMFDAPPPSMAPPPTLAPQQMVSPTLLPNEDDREIAMRQQAGIAGLV